MSLSVIRTVKELEKVVAGWRAQGLRTGFVPTMGALHEGHLSLVRLAKKKADKVVASIFVNPAQFAPHEDFASYPRNEKDDLQKLQSTGADLVYFPSEKEIYPQGMETNIRPGKAAEGLESDFRPHFFGGVVNVVHRLFEQVKPDIAVFGEKDYQQLMVIKEMVATQNMPIDILGGQIVRDEHGLALSSRNAYLALEELQIARTLNKVLEDTVKTGNLESAKAQLLKNGFDKIDYVETRWNRILAAGWIGKTRLIDNVPL